MHSPSPRLKVRADRAGIDRVDDDRLRWALAAIPGNVRATRKHEWILRLGRERARSLRRVAEACGLEVRERSRAELDALCAAPEPASPVIELIHHEGAWLSLIEDWSSLGFEALRAIPDGRAQPDAARYEVPLSEWTAVPIREIVQSHALRLSPAAELALGERLAPLTGSDPLDGPSASIAPGDGVRPLRAPDISMQDGGAHVVAVAPVDQRPLALALAALPKARQLTQGRWLLPSTPEVARAVRALRAREPSLTFDDASERWLREAPRWIATARVEARDATAPVIEVATRWGDPPAALAQLEGARFWRERHELPLTPGNLAALEELVASECEVTLAASVESCLEWRRVNPDAKSVPPAELDVVRTPEGEALQLEPVWREAALDAFIAQQETIAYAAGLRPGDEVPASAWPPDVLARFIKIHRPRITERVRRLISGQAVSDAESERLLAMSQAEDAELEIEGLGGELMAFQRAGVAYILDRRRLFVADEQGLGKTIQALAAIQADLAYPALVVCPASLKLNWAREISHWLPGRDTQILSGRDAAELGGADVIVCNYEIVANHADALAALSPRALVLDESHYVKNPKAARTKAAQKLSERLGPDALRLALTGTPVVNRPAELASQLRVIGRLAEIGSARSLQRGYRSGTARRALHQRLRSTCYLRRRKADVLDQLPAKRRAVVTMPLTNTEEYARAEREFVRWLAEQVDESGQPRLTPDARAIALVRMTALRKLAAEGKLAAALDWIEDFLESEERLVVFAHHRSIQNAVLERFSGAARIIGADSAAEREANVRRFQGRSVPQRDGTPPGPQAEAGGPRLCVCSLEVGSHGFTLTAAANVAFLELGWTPAKHDQATDRVHRIGQDRGVTAWYLLAADTIDERISALLDAKRDVVGSLTDGGAGDEGESLAAELVAGYAGEKAPRRTTSSGTAHCQGR